MLGEKTYCGVASHPGESSDTLSYFMLWNQDRLLLGEPLGSSADCIFVFKRLCHYNCYKHIETVSEKHHHDDKCSVLRYLSVTIVTLYPVRHDRYMIVKVHSYVKVVLLIPSIVL